MKDFIMDECWIVYTNDTRFPTTRIDSVFTTEALAQARATGLNNEDRVLGIPERVSFSHATRFNLRSEPFFG